MLRLFFSFLLAVCLFISVAAAQTPGTLDRSFHIPGIRYSGDINALSQSIDGSTIYLAGRFSFGAIGQNITAYDRSTGAFSKFDGTSIPFPGEIVALHRIGADTIVIGGSFTEIDDDTSMAYLALWDGQSWNPFNGTDDRLDAPVNAIVEFAGRIYIGGSFTEVDGQPAKAVAVWDGDNWSALGTGLDGNGTVMVNDLELFNQSIWIGGEFETAGGSPSANLARWSGAAFLTPPGSIDGPINDMHFLADVQGASGDYILALGGDFTQAGGIAASGFITYRSNTDTWSRKGGGSTTGTINSVLVMTSLDEYLVGGSFTDFAGDSSINRFAVRRDGSWKTIGAGADGDVHDIIWTGTGAGYLIGGDFDVIGNMHAYSIARYMYFDDSIAVFGRGLEGDAFNIALDDNNKPVISGGFNTAGGSPAQLVSRYGTSNWEYLDNDQIIPASGIMAVAAAGNKIWLAGAVLASDNPSIGSSVLQYDGFDWFYQGNKYAFNDEIYDIEFHDNTIWVVGRFDSVDNQPAKGIARWNGTAWEEVDGGLGSAGFPGDGYQLKIDPSDSNIVVAGDFTLAGGRATRGVAKFTDTGWATYNAVYPFLGADPKEGGYPLAMDIGPNGTIYVGGSFDGTLAKFESTVWEFVEKGEFGGAQQLSAIHVQGCDLYLAGHNLFYNKGDGNESVNFLSLSEGVVSVPDYELDFRVRDMVGSGDTLWLAGDFDVAPFDDTFLDYFGASGVVRYFMPSTGIPGDRFIQIEYPSSDDTLYFGNGEVFQFNVLNVDNIKLELSVDSGKTWVDIDRDIDATVLDRIAVLIDRSGDHCFVRATDLDYPCVSSLSDEFSIQLSDIGRQITWLARNRDGDLREPFLPQYHGFQFGNSKSEMWPDEYWQGLESRYVAKGYIVDFIRQFEKARSFSPNYFQTCRALGDDRCFPYGDLTGQIGSSGLLLLRSYQREWGGFCDGFSKAATLFFSLGLFFGFDLYPQYVGQPVADITVDDFSRDFIGGWWTWQMNDLDKDWEDDHEDMTPKETIQWFESAWSGLAIDDDIGPLIIRDLGSDGDFIAGHSVMPYRLESHSTSPDTVYLYVYDNNFPLDTTRKVIVDTVANTWEYTDLGAKKGGNWRGSVGFFPGAPKGVLTQDPDFIRKWKADSRASSADHWVRLYLSGTADARLISQAGDTLGNVEGDDFATDSTVGKPIYVLNPDQEQKRPYGYRVTPEMTQLVELFGFEDTLLTVSFFGDSIAYGYDRFDADSLQTDELTIDSSITLCNPDAAAKTVSLIAIGTYADNEKTYGVEQMILDADDTTAVQLRDDGSLSIENAGGDKTFRLRIRHLDASGAEEVVSGSVFLPANSVQQVVPDFNTLELSDVMLYIDNGRDGSFDDTTMVAVATDVGDDHGAALPNRFALEQNYPNPFNPSTTIRYSLPTASEVKITVVNMLGRTVATLVDARRSAGQHEVVWNGRDDAGNAVASGLYLYRLQSENFRATKKMMLLK